jgi:hypothetical protein
MAELKMEDLKVGAVSEVPESAGGRGRKPNPVYGQLLTSFLEGKDKVLLIEAPDGKLPSLVGGLKNFATEHKTKVQIETRGKTAVYVSRSTKPFTKRVNKKK